MQYEQFRDIFNNRIFEKSKTDLLKKVAEYPDRYTGLFRPTKPRAKLLQNLLQSNEIRFGDAFEEWIETQLYHKGWAQLPKRVTTVDGQQLSFDQLVEKDNTILFIEQKVRDDHDSSKKRGQVTNFETKLDYIMLNYPGKKIVSYFYFIDPSLKKNANYYRQRLGEIAAEYTMPVKLAYGSELYGALGMVAEWQQNLDWLKRWKAELDEMPSIDFDENAEVTFGEVKDMLPIVFRKLFTNQAVMEAILPVLFPQNAVPKLLRDYFVNHPLPIYQKLASHIDDYLAT